MESRVLAGGIIRGGEQVGGWGGQRVGAKWEGATHMEGYRGGGHGQGWLLPSICRQQVIFTAW